MPTRDRYDAGIPSWVDLVSPDVDASKAFYTGVFGWDAEDQHDDEGNRIYTMFRASGHDVAGLGGQPQDAQDTPPFWNSYVATDDADRTAEAAEAAGGRVLLPPMDVMDAGRMAILADPGGAVFSVWQAGDHIGAGLVDEPGAWSWNELLSRHLEDAEAFYAEVFGWSYDRMDMGPPVGTYVVATVGGDQVAGLMAMPPTVPDEVPDHWLIYFTVADADATVAAAGEAGATTLMPPRDVEGVGRLATLQDPQGAAFSIMQHPQGSDG